MSEQSTAAAISAPTWDRHAIRAELARRGFTLIGVALSAGLERSACSVALLRRHQLGEAAIAAALGVAPAELWPERYPLIERRKRSSERRRVTCR